MITLFSTVTSQCSLFSVHLFIHVLTGKDTDKMKIHAVTVSPSPPEKNKMLTVTANVTFGKQACFSSECDKQLCRACTFVDCCECL